MLIVPLFLLQITVNIEAIPINAQPNEDYRVNSSTVVIPDGQTTASVSISIINDQDPEFNESFIVRLLSNGPDGNVLVGSPAQCTVTILENDYPYGLIGRNDGMRYPILFQHSRAILG